MAENGRPGCHQSAIPSLVPLGLDLQCAYWKFSAMVMELCWIP
ncbi:MAG: hypothetical protein QOH35_154 [Acidobacteriaceae bacterium]|jgi:hypothetical protein|nr:hypothetical protein [Acidobacteriaceae bacterium]MEA2538788.1 hypothetical protein [Acidobacteriaceae bacterium]